MMMGWGKFKYCEIVMKRMFKQLVMFNNSTKINKMNNHLSPQAIEHKKTKTYGIGNPGPDLGQVQKCGEIKPSLSYK